MAEIGFGVLHHRHVEEDAGLAKLVIGAEAADRARRGADDRRRLLVPDALAVRPRSDVDRILENARNAAIIFGRDEEDPVSGTDRVTENGVGGRLVAAVIILVVEREVADLDDSAIKPALLQGAERPGDLAVEAALAKAADYRRDLQDIAHRLVLLAGRAA